MNADDRSISVFDASKLKQNWLTKKAKKIQIRLYAKLLTKIEREGMIISNYNR